MDARVAATADVDERAVIGDGCSIWHLAQVREDARLGRNCVVGRGAYIGPGVRLGGLSLPSGSALSDEQFERVTDAILEFVKAAA